MMSSQTNSYKALRKRGEILFNLLDRKNIPTLVNYPPTNYELYSAIKHMGYTTAGKPLSRS